MKVVYGLCECWGEYKDSKKEQFFWPILKDENEEKDKK